MIYSVRPWEEMRNQVTLGASIKCVLIKLHEEVENEASPSRATINYTIKSSTDFFKTPFLSVSQKSLERTNLWVGPRDSR